MEDAKSLISKAQAAYDAAIGLRVEPSIPILYFGDCEAFQKAERRVVTVGLNPGSRAFPNGNPWKFFPAYEKARSLSEAWNQFFRTRPIDDPWMTNLDCMLHGFDSSFYHDKKCPNTALHTDMLSPVPTELLWSRLSRGHQETLADKGVPLWHELIRYLKPHVVLISIAAKHKAKIKFKVVQEWRSVLSISKTKSGEPRKAPYQLEHSVMEICPGFHADFLFGRSAQMPFALLSNHEKEKIGVRLRNQLANW